MRAPIGKAPTSTRRPSLMMAEKLSPSDRATLSQEKVRGIISVASRKCAGRVA